MTVLSFCLMPRYIFAAVDLPNGNYSESVEELRVKVLGGYVVVERHHVEDRWQINPHWNSLQFTLDNFDGAIKSISRQGSIYNRVGDVWSASDNRSRIRRQSVSLLPPAPASVPASGIPGASGQGLISALGFRWSETTGNWIDYDAQGRIAVYGDKNDVKVWFQYDGNGKLKYVLDHFGRVMLTYTWSGESLTQIEDNPALISGNTAAARTVKFYYEGVSQTTPSYPLLVRVSDVLGYDTTFTYTQDRVASITDAENRTRTLTYGATGRVDKVQEADGAETSYLYEYDRTKRQFYVRITYPPTQAGRSIEEIWYDSEGQVIRRDANSKTRSMVTFDPATRSKTRTDGQGATETIQRDEYGNPIRITFPDGSTITSRFSPLHGQRLEETDELGARTTYEYDAKGNPLKKTQATGLPEQRVTEFIRDAYGQLVARIQKGATVTLPDRTLMTVPDAVLNFEYDQQGNITKMIDAENNSTHYRYDLQGNVIQNTDANNNSRSATYDAKGELLTYTNVLNQTSHHRYNKQGQRLETKDFQGNITTYRYDANGRLTEITNTLGHSRKLLYDAMGKVIAQMDENDIHLQQSYDLNGNVIESKDANGNTQRTSYDDSGFLETQTQFPTYTQRYSYDARYRRTETIDDLGNGTVYVSKRAFNSRNEVTSSTDRNGKTTRFIYDALGQTVQQIDATGGVTKHSYDPRGNLLAVQDAKGNMTVYTYDKNNRRVSEQQALGQTIQYTYDRLGNQTQVIDAAGNKLNNQYDTANRLIQETHTAAGQTSPHRTITYSYSPNGVTGYTDNNNGFIHSASYTLDALGRRIQETVTYAGLSFTLQTSYLPSHKKGSFTYPDNFKLDYQYDANQVISAVVFPNGAITVNESLWNEPKKITYPGGTVLLREYDPLMRVTQIRWNDPGQANLLNYQYSYDPASNITQKQTEHGNYAYHYDDLYRLVQATNPNPLSNEIYTYDPLGNRLSDSNKPGAWLYNANNQLTQGTNQSGQTIVYGYDGAGSLINQNNLNNANANREFIYDAARRLIELKDASGATLALYRYDPFGRRIAKTVNGVTTYFIYSEEGLIAEANSAGQITVQYGWLPYGARDAQSLNEERHSQTRSTWGTHPLFLRQHNQLYFYQNDHLGTPQKLIDQQGQVLWQARQNSFGETIVLPGATLTNNLRFAGQYYDQESGLHQNHFRDYAPHLGRYLQSDPIGLRGGPNTFSYVANNPLSNIDPNGLISNGLFVSPNPPPTCGNAVVVCENEQLVIHIPNCGLGDLDCGIRECLAAHEQSHIDDFINRFGPNLCRGVIPGRPLGFDSDCELQASELKGCQVELNCLQRLLRDDPPCEQDKCRQKIQNAIAGVLGYCIRFRSC